MKNKQLHKSFCYIVLTLLLLVVTVISGGFIVPAFADTATSYYTNVLDDLQKDEIFNVSDYPVKLNDYSLQVIQIAEGVNDDVFIYVYQPCGQTKKYIATTINISPTKSDKYYENFELELINSSGTLYKYRVVDYYSTRGKAIRIYDISSIFRAWDNEVDGVPANDNTASEKAYPVGQCWTAVTVNGEVIYSCEEVELLDVTKQFVHFLRYSDGFKWGGVKSCDAHYFAFSCDKSIDRLLSADLKFYTQEYKKMEGQNLKLLDEKTSHYITVDYTMQGASKKEKWQRLSSTSEFLKEAGDNVSSDEAKKIKQYDWIINFYETEYERDFGGKDILISLLLPGGFIWGIIDACTTYGVVVTDVMLMRLEFEYDGKIYNMGVVSDKVSGSPNPPKGDSGLPALINNMPWWGWLIVAIVALIVLVIIIQILGLFFPVVKGIFSAVWFVICLPFRGIKALINKIRGE